MAFTQGGFRESLEVVARRTVKGSEKNRRWELRKVGKGTLKEIDKEKNKNGRGEVGGAGAPTKAAKDIWSTNVGWRYLQSGSGFRLRDPPDSEGASCPAGILFLK
jgi:hypothetical protein